MRTLDFPAIGSYNNRSFASAGGKDQFSKGCIISRIFNRQSNSATYYIEKRTGLVSKATPASGQIGFGCYASPSGNLLSAYLNGTVSTLFYNTTNCGILDSSALLPYITFTETIIGGITYYLITTASVLTSGTGWYLASDSVSNISYTADGNNSTTITDIKVAGVNSVAGLYIGQKLTAGANIVAGSRIVSINAGAFSAVLDTATTGGAFNDLAITKEHVAKMNDADFPSDIVGGFSELDGYINIMTYSGRVYQSDLNTVSSWNPANYMTPSKYTGYGIGVFRYRNQILSFKGGGVEFLYNAGNPAGSTMSSSDNSVGSTTIVPLAAIGCSIANGIPYWLGSDLNIYALEGFSPKKISTLGATNLFTNINIQTIFVSSFVFNKKTYLNLAYQVPGNYWYSVDDDTWSEPAFGAVAAYASAGFGAANFVLGDTSGKTFNLNYIGSSFTFLDNGAAFTMSIQIAIDAGQLGSKGGEFSMTADLQASGSVTISTCDDDSGTFGSTQSISMTNGDMRIRLGGIFFNRRLIKIEHSANTPCRIKKIKYQVKDL